MTWNVGTTRRIDGHCYIKGTSVEHAVRPGAIWAICGVYVAYAPSGKEWPTDGGNICQKCRRAIRATRNFLGN